MKLFLASGNAHKAVEFQALADGSLTRDGSPASRPLQIEIVPATAAGGMPPVIEDAGTFVGNAR